MIFLILLTFADNLYSQGDFYRAITEYRREIFLSPEDFHAAERIADSYYKLGDYKNALFWYGRALFLNESDRIKEKYIYLLARAGKFDDLEILIESKEHPVIKAIDNLKRPSSLRYVSYVLPGGTQILCGEFKTGILSILWNGLAIYLGYNSIKKHDIPGIIFSISLFQRFYMGNLTSARAAVRRKKLKEYRKVVESIRPEDM